MRGLVRKRKYLEGGDGVEKNEEEYREEFEKRR
jgi:hypothetical protein